ncbi:uncharacterized protein LOC142627226 [Castanea sativa]|uniref:uncharacterized protein LOC142627226 n=1 Tax=Castanea sativa TaxID=21020 RepID=UPI003F64D6D3
MKCSRSAVLQALLLHSTRSRRSFASSSLSSVQTLSFLLASSPSHTHQSLQNPLLSRFLSFSLKPNPSLSSSSSITHRFLRTTTITTSSSSSSSSSSSEEEEEEEEDPFQCETNEDGESTDGWEEEAETEPEIGDGGDGGGIVLQGVPWGELVLSIANDVLLQFSDDMKLYAFKTTPRGYIYVRLDKLSNEYGCPSMEELENYSQEIKKRLDEGGELGKIPKNLAFEVSSPGAERILMVPDDLHRFKDKPMRVCYVEDVESKGPEKDGIYMLDSIETESESCLWKLADVKENRDPQSRGRPLSRKQRDWRLKLPFGMHKRVFLYLEF